MKKIIALLLCYTTSAWGGIAYIQSRSNSTNSSATTSLAFSSNVTAGSLLIVGCVTNRLAAALTVTDNNSNVYTLINGTTTKNNSVGRVGVWYAFNASAGATTVTCVDTNTQGTWVQMAIHEYSGAAVTIDPFDVASTSAPVVAYVTKNMLSNNATTSTTLELMFNYAAIGLGSIVNQNGTKRTDFVDNVYMASQDAIIPTASVYQSSFTAASNNSGWVSIQAAFFDAASSPPPPGFHSWK